ncbi:MAG: hypothetical protein A2X36_10155 [Elusimicrobia bacterium GWA2_69_24]|nr:MAG: hypothetical protein A2X36_10155 [Elusimicrobia bacterium GWA2_69_24]HBL19200.1 hypothetical protein [Elusimicrobiota bacterium]
MTRYDELARRSWKSGEYKAAPESPNAAGAGSGEAEALRSFLRSKLEWIVEREAYDPLRGPAEHPSIVEGAMKLAQYVKFREEKFGGVLFETRSERVFTLSPTGAAVVREIAGGGDEAAIVARLKARFQDPSGAIEREATEFLAFLKEKGLVEQG